MVLLQFGLPFSYVISEATLKHGMDHYVLVVYRNAVRAVVITPFAFWLESIQLSRPVIDQNLYYVGSKLTSKLCCRSVQHTSHDNILDSLSSQVNLKRRHSQAKVIGSVITFGGAVLLILYKGPIVSLLWSKGRTHHGAAGAVLRQGGGGGNFFRGTLMLLASCMACEEAPSMAYWLGHALVYCNLQRFLGPIVLLIGVYALIWGKSNDNLITFTDNVAKKGVSELPVVVSKGAVANSSDDNTVVEMSMTKT
ncbi:hypothetical protein HPP92_016143 [Vanilla planifolia]|uniref:WAT1-related protein n=1 Tax=Vanilla planifolia TaxID=51239 RepID=A0A835QPQ3_VANPL|nr:hypothetical protein HPP92_016143 [Vanilla planifolia]